jgi:6-phosphogluconolactonase
MERDIITINSKKGVFRCSTFRGKTPIDFYKRLSSYNRTFPWDRTHIFWADERYVPPDSNDSNYYLIKEHLLKSIHIPEKNIHPVPTQEETLDRSAKKYEEDIKGFFALGDDTFPEFPEFDLIMLGIGEDGDTGSGGSGSDHANLSKFNQMYSNNTHFKGLKRHFQGRNEDYGV